MKHAEIRARDEKVLEAYRQHPSKVVARMFGLAPDTVRTIISRRGHGGIKSRVKAERDQAIVAEYATDTAATIAARHGLTVPYVVALLSAAGASIPHEERCRRARVAAQRRRVTWTPEMDDCVRRCAALGWPAVRIAEEVGVCKDLASLRRRELGLPAPTRGGAL